MTFHTDLLLDPFGGRVADAVNAAKAAEEAGFDGIWTWDHLAGRVHGASHVLECWTLLTTIAAHTERVAVGPLVLNVANREPGVVAMMAATLQEASGGRLLLGIGAGGGPGTPYPEEQRALGRAVPGDATRRAAVEQAVEAIRDVWTGRDGFLRPDPPPPIVVGGFGPKMAALAGKIGDGFNTPASHPQLAELISIATREHTGAEFLVTASASLSPRWVDEESGQRARLRDLGVSRVILGVPPPYDSAQIRALGRHARTVTLAKFFDDVAAGIGLGPPVDRAAIAELRADLTRALDEVGARIPHDAPHARAHEEPSAATCSHARPAALVANEVVAELGPALVLGHLVDRIVSTYVVVGRVPDDPFASAIESLKAERSTRTLAWLDAAPPDVIADLRDDLAHRVSQVASRGLPWTPIGGRDRRTRRALPFAEGRLVLSGRFDLLLGGRVTDFPRLVIEVKSGSATGVHQPDLYWYALLAALRDGVAPRCVAVWTAADGLTTTAPISADALRSAAMRIVAGAERWTALLAGRSPTLTAHPGCRWCALLDVCATGQGWQPDGVIDDHWLDADPTDESEDAGDDA